MSAYDRAIAIMFDPGDLVCAGNQYATAVKPVEALTPSDGEFLCINALKDSRRDSNVVKFRTFLVECDTGTLEEQRAAIDAVEMPWSVCTYSGGKSLHFLVCLEKPLPMEDAYRTWARWLLHGLSVKGVGVDRATGNPSRFSRNPGAMRGSVEQHVVEVRGRVPNTEFVRFLATLEKPEDRVTRDRPPLPPGVKLPAPVWVMRSVQDGVLGPSGSRSQSVYAMARELFDCGWGREEILAFLSPCKAWFGDDYGGQDRVEKKVSEAEKASGKKKKGE